jgi:hypothetical protein
MDTNQAGKPSGKNRAASAPDAQQNEGEGNRTAARRYDRKATAFARSGAVTEQAEAAKAARESEERDQLDEAEKVGRSRAKGEDPAVKR